MCGSKIRPLAVHSKFFLCKLKVLSTPPPFQLMALKRHRELNAWSRLTKQVRGVNDAVYTGGFGSLVLRISHIACPTPIKTRQKLNITLTALVLP